MFCAVVATQYSYPFFDIQEKQPRKEKSFDYLDISPFFSKLSIVSNRTIHLVEGEINMAQRYYWNPSEDAFDYAVDHLRQGPGEEILCAGWIDENCIWFIQRCSVDFYYWIGWFDARYNMNEMASQPDYGEPAERLGYDSLLEIGRYYFYDFDPDSEPIQLDRIDEYSLEAYIGENLAFYDIDALFENLSERDMETGTLYWKKELTDYEMMDIIDECRK